ncbi:hypothetical protein E1218_27425 [Kribbella turkmenica]|uniref:Uncharacterized protein n=1 Tax=Kribbella turkmenica TaxID=2530375 RepID=A0A4R4WFH8_9ACTN|nr:hypothetical protein [Kribbella turkmenica]TDD17662.1 hypothetical protein E1218_27425 [Kribbella turkmenica]
MSDVCTAAPGTMVSALSDSGAFLGPLLRMGRSPRSASQSSYASFGRIASLRRAMRTKATISRIGPSTIAVSGIPPRCSTIIAPSPT